MNNRRAFLQTTATVAGSMLLPKVVFAKPSSNFHLLQTDTLNHWPVLDCSVSTKMAQPGS